MTFLKILGGIVLVLWLIGFIFKFLGGFIHILLVASVIIFLIDMLTPKRDNR